MRVLTKPATARCTLEHYTAFLLAESQSAGCVRLAEVSGGAFAHDAANRFLNREEFNAKDLFDEARPLMVLAGGTLSVDDTVLEKPHSQEGKTELVGYFWSSKAGKAVKGLCLVTLLRTDAKGFSCPVNFRVVDKAEGRTKNEHFRDMVLEVLAWGLRPVMVTADSWFSGLENLKFLKDQGLGFLIALEKNRVVSAQAHDYVSVSSLDLPGKGKALHLRGFGFVGVFRTVDKHGTARHYAQFEPRKKSAWKSPLPASCRCTASSGRSRATTVPSNSSARWEGASCAGRRPSATTSSVACEPSSNWKPNAQAAGSPPGISSSVTSLIRPSQGLSNKWSLNLSVRNSCCDFLGDWRDAPSCRKRYPLRAGGGGDLGRAALFARQPVRLNGTARAYIGLRRCMTAKPPRHFEMICPVLNT